VHVKKFKGERKNIQVHNSGQRFVFLYFSFSFNVLACDSMYAIARHMPSPVRLSVCPWTSELIQRSMVCHTGGSVKDG